MSKEIEVRVRITADEVEKNPSLGRAFRAAKRYEETNVVFCHPAGLRPIRLRRYRDKTRNWQTLELTLKGENETPKSKVRVREELNVRFHPSSFTQYKELRVFLGALGYVQDFVYEKSVRETTYFTKRGRLAKLFWVTVPALGDFLEIEGESSRTVLGVLKGLGLAHAEIENRSYRELAPDGDLVFDTQDRETEEHDA